MLCAQHMHDKRSPILLLSTWWNDVKCKGHPRKSCFALVHVDSLKKELDFQVKDLDVTNEIKMGGRLWGVFRIHKLEHLSGGLSSFVQVLTGSLRSWVGILRGGSQDCPDFIQSQLIMFFWLCITSYSFHQCRRLGRFCTRALFHSSVNQNSTNEIQKIHW